MLFKKITRPYNSQEMYLSFSKHGPLFSFVWGQWLAYAHIHYIPSSNLLSETVKVSNRKGIES